VQVLVGSSCVGAVVSEFSTQSRDDLDIFTDPEINRMPVYGD